MLPIYRSSPPSIYYRQDKMLVTLRCWSLCKTLNIMYSFIHLGLNYSRYILLYCHIFVDTRVVPASSQQTVYSQQCCCKEITENKPNICYTCIPVSGTAFVNSFFSKTHTSYCVHVSNEDTTFVCCVVNLSLDVTLQLFTCSFSVYGANNHYVFTN